MKDLNELNVQELKEFFNSFDYLLSDIDGVLWPYVGTIPGAQDAMKSLKKIGKKIILVTNNSSITIQNLHKKLEKAKFNIDEDDIVTPILSIVSYLKKQDLKDKRIYLIGATPLRTAIEKAGFKVAEQISTVEESSSKFPSATLEEDDTIGAVVCENDYNLTYAKLQQATTYLLNPNILFVKGASDRQIPIGNKILLGPGFFSNLLEDITGRKAVPIAKPGIYLNKYIVEKYGIKDKERVLFVGDSVPADMGFAAENNYRKLLVLSGVTGRKELEEWTFPQELKPDYYASNLKVFHDCIQRCFTN